MLPTGVKELTIFTLIGFFLSSSVMILNIFLQLIKDLSNIYKRSGQYVLLLVSNGLETL